MNGYEASGIAPGTILMITGIWTIVFIAFYVWYLWSLSRLFPRIGLPAGYGWIPVWNQWQLVSRGGLPGWLVLLGLLPGLGIVVFIVTIIAINRINSEYGKGAGFTVLGVFIPPVWAMLLAAHIDDAGHRAPGAAGVLGSRAAAGLPYTPPGYARAQARPAAAVAAETPVSAPTPGYAPGYAPAGTTVQPNVAPGAQVQAQAPAQFAQPQAQAPQSPAGYPASPPPVTQAPWVQPSAVPVTPAAPSAPLAAPAAPVQPVPAPEPELQSDFDALFAPQTAAAPADTGAANASAANPASSGWGFSNTTEDAFERLAAQEREARPDAWLGQQEVQRPFSWPLPQPAQAALPATPVVPAVPVVPATPVVPAVPVARAGAAPVSSAPAVPVTDAPPAFAAPSDANAPAVPLLLPEPAGAPAAELTADEPSMFSSPQHGQPAAWSDADDDEDRTIVVPKRKRWGLELPTGETYELVGDDIVIGRRPVAVEGAAALQVEDPTRTISKSHARMRRTGDQWTIEDLHSTNGVALLDSTSRVHSIEPGEQAAVTDHMTIGTLEVVLRELV